MINLLYAGNDKVFDGLLISLLSVVKHTKEEIKAFVFTMDMTELDPKYKPLNEKHRLFIEKEIKKVNPLNEIVLVDCKKEFIATMNKKENINTAYTPYTLLRLISDKIEGIPDKVLYLDTDTVSNNSVEELYNIDVTDYEFAGVRDYYGKIFIGPNYINAGVLLFNIKKIRETKLFEKSIHLLNTKKMSFPDQTALNKSVIKKLIIKPKYNSQRRWHESDVIQHFCKSIRWIPFFHTLNIKPWMVSDVHKKLKNYHYDELLYEYIALKKEFNENYQK